MSIAVRCVERRLVLGVGCLGNRALGWLESGDVIVAVASGVLGDDWESGVWVATLICWQLAAHL